MAKLPRKTMTQLAEAKAAEVGLQLPPDPATPVRLRDQALFQKWQETAFQLQKEIGKAIREERATDARNYTLAAGIATDKALLLAGRPTSISAQLHDIRVQLPELAGKLAAVANRLAAKTIDVPANG